MKTKLLIILSVFTIISLGFYILKPESIDFKEIQLTDLPSDIQNQINLTKKSNNTSYLFLSDNPNQSANVVYFYFNRNNNRQLYSFPTAEASVNNNKMRIHIKEQDALNDSEVRDTLLLEFQVQSLPEHIEVFFNKEKINLKNLHIKHLFKLFPCHHAHKVIEKVIVIKVKSDPVLFLLFTELYIWPDIGNTLTSSNHFIS